MITNPRTSAIGQLMAAGAPSQPSILVVGCGNGCEAAVLALELDATVTGVDLTASFDENAGRYARLQRGDATSLAFADQSFDFVYSYHVLEHIPEYDAALAEMKRVLKPSGRYCIGTPNRRRLVGYVGGDSTWPEKVRWNMADWRARAAGRFRNEYGAHAGFTSEELGGILARHFSATIDVTELYYRALYERYGLLLDILVRTGLARYLFPSVYFMGDR